MVDITPKSDMDDSANNLKMPEQADTTDTNMITEEPLTETSDPVLQQNYSLPVEKQAKRNKKSFTISAPVMIILSVLILAVAGSMALLSRHGDPVPEAPVLAPVKTTEAMSISLSILEGSAEVSNSETSLAEATFSELSEATRLRAGQYIKTAESSRLAFTLGDGSIIRLSGNTTIQIDELAKDDVQVSVLSGQVYTRVTSDPSRNFQVKTSSDSFKSIGTAYLTEVVQDAEIVKVFEGSVRTKDGSSIKEGQTFGYRGLPSEPAPLETADLRLEDIVANEFIIWNREQDLAIEAFEDKLGFLADLKAPELSISSPEDNAETTEEKITIKGTTEADAELTINDIAVTVNTDGTFSYELPLNVGENGAIIIATDSADNETKIELAITREAEGSAVNEAPPITLVGETGTNGIDLAWSLLGETEETGLFKVVYNTTGEPEYKTDASQTTDDEGTVLPRTDGKTYKIRVCVFDEDTDTCTDYSNEVSVKAPTQ